MTDGFARLNNAVMIWNKGDKWKFLLIIELVFNSLDYIFSNYESEFIDESFYEVREKFNIKISSTLSYSPRDNVMCFWRYVMM